MHSKNHSDLKNLPVNGISCFTSASRISSLHNIVFLNIMEQTIIVVLDLAQLEEVLARIRTIFDEQVNSYIPQ
jgi:hypothetical protein